MSVSNIGSGVVYEINMALSDELGNWRPKRNGFDEEFFNAYHDFIPRSEPVADYDDRNALYAL